MAYPLILPIELWDVIAKTDLRIYGSLIYAIPAYGRRMSCPKLNRSMRIHFTVSQTDEDARRWFLNGKCHREDGPAIESSRGDRDWWLHGRRHREDGPAYEGANGDRKWCFHGEYHREDGPACEWADGTRHWCRHGRLHREDGPAVEGMHGIRIWYLRGIRQCALENIKHNA